MFLNFFKKIIKFLINKVGLNNKIRYNNVTELLITSYKFYKTNPLIKRTSTSLKIFKKKTNKKILKKTTVEFFWRLYYVRLFFYEFLTKSDFTLFFKNEWQMLYNKQPQLHKIWLFFTRRYFYYYRDSFLLRSSNLYKLFNKNPVNPGKYIYKPTLGYFNTYVGFLSFWKAIKIWVFSTFVFVISFYILLLKRVGVLPQTLFFWVSMGMLMYWLISGFVFFVKKYQYSRYTSAIQRFWRRSYILFWLIESGLLCVFFYLMVNSSQESFYMFDQISILKTHLFSWKLFLFKSILVVSLITYGYLFLVNLKWAPFNKNILNLVILTIFLLYFVWVEFYQIYWVSNFYANLFWIFDFDDNLWSLEWDARRTRILNHYIMILFLLKFWHIIFILGCWFFFLLRISELETISYTLYSFNFQNFIILFLMSWLFMYPWLRYLLHFVIETVYYWFYVDTHFSFYRIFINDFYFFYFCVITHIFEVVQLYYLNITDFLNLDLFTITTDTNNFIKNTIKNKIFKDLI